VLHPSCQHTPVSISFENLKMHHAKRKLALSNNNKPNPIKMEFEFSDPNEMDNFSTPPSSPPPLSVQHQKITLPNSTDGSDEVTEIHKSSVQYADRVSDMYVNRIGTTLSITLGLGQATLLSRSTDFFRVLGTILIGIAIAYYVQKYAQKKEFKSIFVLFWRFIVKLCSFFQQLLITIAISVAAFKIAEEDSRSSISAAAGFAPGGIGTTSFSNGVGDPIDEFYVRMFLYASIFIIVTALPLLQHWIFIEHF
jgi:hypothetical protein